MAISESHPRIVKPGVKIGFDFGNRGTKQPLGVLIKPTRPPFDVNRFRDIGPKRTFDESLESVKPVDHVIQVTAIHDHQTSQGGLEAGFVLSDQAQTKPFVPDSFDDSGILDLVAETEQCRSNLVNPSDSSDDCRREERQMAEHRFGKFRPFQAVADGFVEGHGGFCTQAKGAYLPLVAGIFRLAAGQEFASPRFPAEFRVALSPVLLSPVKPAFVPMDEIVEFRGRKV